MRRLRSRTGASAHFQITPSRQLAARRLGCSSCWGSRKQVAVRRLQQIAVITAPVAESLVVHAEIGAGDRVLDVATGTGHAALAAARRSAVVTASPTCRVWSRSPPAAPRPRT